MSKRSIFGLSAVTVAVLLAAGGLMASNMGFKLNRALKAAAVGVSANGTNALALPFNQQVGLSTASTVVADMGGLSTAGGPVINLQKLNPVTNGYTLYNGGRSPNFAIVAGEAYRVRVASNLNYIAVGSHNPSLNVTLKAAAVGVSANGTNEYAYPYHSTSANASQLATELGGLSTAGGPVINVQNLNPVTNAYTLYNGGRSPNFALTPGFGYRVRVQSDVTFVPSHY